VSELNSSVNNVDDESGFANLKSGQQKEIYRGKKEKKEKKRSAFKSPKEPYKKFVSTHHVDWS
jgi:hypothetical protein